MEILNSDRKIEVSLKAKSKIKKQALKITWDIFKLFRKSLFNSLLAKKVEIFVQAAMIVTSVKKKNIGSRDANRPIRDKQGLRL